MRAPWLQFRRRKEYCKNSLRTIRKVLEKRTDFKMCTSPSKVRNPELKNAGRNLEFEWRKTWRRPAEAELHDLSETLTPLPSSRGVDMLLLLYAYHFMISTRRSGFVQLLVVNHSRTCSHTEACIHQNSLNIHLRNCFLESINSIRPYYYARGDPKFVEKSTKKQTASTIKYGFSDIIEDDRCFDTKQNAYFFTRRLQKHKIHLTTRYSPFCDRSLMFSFMSCLLVVEGYSAFNDWKIEEKKWHF